LRRCSKPQLISRRICFIESLWRRSVTKANPI
jgi:hypothetical protein